MKKILYGIAAAITLALAGVYAYAFAQPDEWSVKHERTVDAEPATVYAAFANLEQWASWTSWGPIADETATWDLGETTSGKGATATWNGERLGEGRIIITQSEEPDRIEYDLWFAGRDEPSSGVISLTATNDGTLITWIDRGSVEGNPLLRLLVPQIQRQLSDDIERSLIRVEDDL